MWIAQELVLVWMRIALVGALLYEMVWNAMGLSALIAINVGLRDKGRRMRGDT